MAVKQQEYESIIKYIQQKLQEKVTNVGSHGEFSVRGIYEEQLQEMPKYEDWKAQHKPTRTKRVVAVGEYAAMFEELWSRWPATGNFTYEGKKYISDRVLRSNKQVCLGLYTKAITEGHKWTDINHAAKVEVAIKKQESAKKGVNQLQYLSSLEVWLRQQRWIAWEGVEIPQADKKVPVTNSTDM